jgi:hypothetical protein
MATPPHPNKYEGSRPIEGIQSNQIHLPFIVSYLLLSLNPSSSNLVCCSSLVSAMSEGILGGLANPRAILIRRSTAGISPATGLAGPPHQSDRVDAEALRQLPLHACWPLERCQQIGVVGEFRKTRHPRNVKFNKVLKACFSGAGDLRFSEAWDLRSYEFANVRNSGIQIR